MTLHAHWVGEGRKAEYPPDPRYPLGVPVDCTEGQPGCEVALQYPAPCVGKWWISCDTCGTTAIVTAAGRVDDPHTVRLRCLAVGRA